MKTQPKCNDSHLTSTKDKSGPVIPIVITARLCYKKSSTKNAMENPIKRNYEASTKGRSTLDLSLSHKSSISFYGTATSTDILPSARSSTSSEFIFNSTDKYVSEAAKLKQKVKELEMRNAELERMYKNEKEEKSKLIKGATEERVQWNREKTTLIELNQKLSKMLQQIDTKIASIKENNK